MKIPAILPVVTRLYNDDDSLSVETRMIQEQVRAALQYLFDDALAKNQSIRDLSTIITSEVHYMASITHLKKQIPDFNGH